MPAYRCLSLSITIRHIITGTGGLPGHGIGDHRGLGAGDLPGPGAGDRYMIRSGDRPGAGDPAGVIQDMVPDGDIQDMVRDGVPRGDVRSMLNIIPAVTDPQDLIPAGRLTDPVPITTADMAVPVAIIIIFPVTDLNRVPHTQETAEDTMTIPLPTDRVLLL